MMQMIQRARLTILALALGAVLAPQAQAQSAPWVFGLGTGFSLLNTEGTQGFNTTAFGPIESDYDLSPGDVNDLLETAFGFGAMATNGSWSVNAGFMKLNSTGNNPSVGGYMGTVAETAGFPQIFNIEADPKERVDVAATGAGWIMGPYLQAVMQYQATLLDHPNPPAPDVTRFSR